MRTNVTIGNQNARNTYAEALRAARRQARKTAWASKRDRIEGSPYFLIGYLVQEVNGLENRLESAK